MPPTSPFIHPSPINPTILPSAHAPSLLSIHPLISKIIHAFTNLPKVPIHPPIPHGRPTAILCSHLISYPVKSIHPSIYSTILQLMHSSGHPRTHSLPHPFIFLHPSVI